MQLLCNNVDLHAISPALAKVFENMTPVNQAIVSVKLQYIQGGTQPDISPLPH